MRPQQKTFAEAGFEKHYKPTRREQFLNEMNQVVPWVELCALIEPFYPKNDGAGRPTVGLERMLRVYFLQQGFKLSDPAVEEALYDSRAVRAFVGIDLGVERAPDEKTVCKFRHLLEAHSLGEQIFALVNAHLAALGLTLSRGAIVDATIINAPSSTKNKAKARDPEMHQTKKGNQWSFGMKAHRGIDSKSKLMHAAVATSANVHDSKILLDLLHGTETRVWGDAAYTGQREAIRRAAPKAQDFTHEKARRAHPLTEAQKARNKTKSKVRPKGEHPFLVIKRLFGFAKIRYRGLMKNAHRLFVTCALANLFMVRRRLLRLAGA